MFPLFAVFPSYQSTRTLVVVVVVVGMLQVTKHKGRNVWQPSSPTGTKTMQTINTTNKNAQQVQIPQKEADAAAASSSKSQQRSRGVQLQHYVFISVQRGDGDS